MPVFGEKIPVRKSARLNAEPVCLDTTPTQCSRPTFNLNVFTPSPVRKKSEGGGTPKVIVIESSKKKDSDEGPSKSLKRKGKEKVDLANDSDFEDEIPIMKRYRLNQEQNSENVRSKSRGRASFKGDNRQPKKSTMKPKKGRAKSPKRTSKENTKQPRWLSYINFGALGEISKRLEKLNMLDIFKQSPFGYLLQLPEMHVQPQLIRHLLQNEVSSDMKETFTFCLNSSLIEFGIAEFKAVTDFKCGTLDDFVHELVGPSKLMVKYFQKFKNRSVPKEDFIRVLKDGEVIEPDDVFQMCIIYFNVMVISWFQCWLI